MKMSSHINRNLPYNYGGNFLKPKRVICYLSEIIAKIELFISGTLLDAVKSKAQGKVFTATRLKMGESQFIKRLNQEESIKYGAAVYLIVAMLTIPAGICSSQYASLDLLPSHQLAQFPSVYSLLDELGAAQAAEYHRIERQKAAEAWLQAQPAFHSHVVQASRAYGIDAALIRAIIMVESSNNPKAVSYRGAQGLMQLMPRTAKWLGVKDSFNPAHNIDGGVRYIRSLLDRFGGDVILALAAYNAGSRHVRNYGGVPPFKATKIYIKKVLEYRQSFEKELAVGELASITS